MSQATYVSGNENGLTISLKELEVRTGVMHQRLNPARYKADGSLDRIREERGYAFADEIIVSPDLAKYAEILEKSPDQIAATFGEEIEITQNMPKYAEKIAFFHNEHLHCEEEVLFVTQGSIYVDVRDAKDDSWVRVDATPGDFFILPAGGYHRLTFKDRQPVTIIKLCMWKPIWPCYFRSEDTDDLECRKTYIDCYKNKKRHESGKVEQSRPTEIKAK